MSVLSWPRQLQRDDLPARPIEILLVEDNPGDVGLTVEALRDGKVSNHLSLALDGLEALAFVRRERHFAEAPRPDLILLDLDLPLKDGREVLAEIKADPELRAIPVVIMTVSHAEQDILRAQQLEVRAYIVKPLDLRQFIDVIESIESLWLTIASFPQGWQPPPVTSTLKHQY